MSTPRGAQAWEKVLAAIEADTIRAAALLASDPAAADLDPAELARRAIATSADADHPGVDDPLGTQQYTYLDDVPAAQPKAPQTGAGQGIPANWRLPTNQPAAATPELPDPADMPPIPAELRARIERLQDRINSLKIDLAKAMAEVRAISQPTHRLPTEDSPPGFVDRRV